ncbi:MAG: hypothetical protein GY842_16240, partial [bacterium]|nr:hypothetical protein [bacterium]
RIKHMPCETTGGLVVFVEADRVGWDGAGQLAGVTLRRPFYSYRPITDDDSLLYHSPSPLPDGAVLVAARPDDRSALHETVTHGVYRLDPTNGEAKLIYNDPRYHDFHAKVLAPRPRPDGRSSVVNEKYATGKLYCLNAYLTDPETTPHMRPGMIRAVRVIEGVPLRAGALAQSDDDRPRGLKSAAPFGSATTVQKRLLGLAPVEEDGSFHIEIPADVPVQLQTLDENGMALRSCGWIWVKHREPRGCIGCHEDPELTPENRFVQAMQHPGMKLTLPPEKRRTVDFRRDVMPIVTRKCAACHVDGDGLDLRSAEDGPFNRAYRSLMAGIPERGEQELGTAPVTGTYVHPGQARTSPLIWRLFGRNTSQPWDDEYDPDRTVGTCPPHGPERLTDAERLTFIEWIDLGAHMSGAPEPEPAPHPPGMAPSDENGDE